jgi:hypothetical protein
LRLIDAPARIISSLTSRLDPVLEPADEGDPDIVVRFRELTRPSEFAHIGQNFAGFGDGRFFVLDEVSGQLVAQIPLGAMGGQCALVCSTTARSVPLLFDLIIVAFWSKGLAPLHASAFIHNGVGVLVMGWPKGGKTGAMLAFIEDGAEYVGDEWVFVDPTNQIVYGLPLPVGVSEWQWEQLPHLVPRRTAQQRIIFSLIHSIEWLASTFDRTRYRKSPIVKSLQQGVPALRRQLKISKSPQVLFPGRIGSMRMTPDKVFLVIDRAQPGIRSRHCSRRCRRGVVARRLDRPMGSVRTNAAGFSARACENDR